MLYEMGINRYSQNYKAYFIYQLWGVNVPSSALSDNGTTSPIGDCRVNRIGIFSRSGLSRCKNRIQDSSESRLEVPVNNKWYCV